MTSISRVRKQLLRAGLVLPMMASLMATTAARADLIKSGKTTLVSSNSGGQAGDGSRPSISGDGRYVAFESWDSLTPDDTDGGNSDIYIKDTLTGITTLATPTDSHCNTKPTISRDGTGLSYLAGGWGTFSVGLGIHDPGEFCYGSGVMFRDLPSGVTRSINDYVTFNAKMSKDGRYVAAIENPSEDDQYFLSYLGGIMPAGNSPWTRYPTLSGDGSSLFFVTYSGRSTGEQYAIVARNLVANTSELVAYGYVPVIRNFLDVNQNGQIFAFTSASAFTTDDLNPLLDVYVRDRSSGTTHLVSTIVNGLPAAEDAYNPSISSDGKRVAFATSPYSWLDYFNHLNRRVYLRDLTVPCDLPVCEPFSEIPSAITNPPAPPLPPWPSPPSVSLSSNSDRFAPFDDATVCYYSPYNILTSGLSSTQTCTSSSAETTSVAHAAQMGLLSVGGTGYVSTALASGYVAGVYKSSAMSVFHASSSATLTTVAKIDGTTFGNFPHTVCLLITDSLSGAQLGSDCLNKPTSVRDL
ncbi:MAG: hypothetical protein LC723_07700, partial [Actinobacteria bacterium]|nr:hypothetical protein [Actinomycetota bacterium]